MTKQIAKQIAKPVIGALCAVALVLGSLSGCAVLGGRSLEISAMFKDSAGLFVGNDVGVLGVRIGTVKTIVPEGEGVKVTMVITDEDVKIPADAGAVIVSRSVATDRYVEITPTYKSGPQIKAGTLISIDKTETPVDFDAVLTALNKFSVGIAGSKDTKQAIARFLKVSADTLGPHGKDMNEAITNLGEAVNGISGQRDDIVGTMTSLDKLVTTLVNNKQVVQRFVDSVAATTDILASERANFQEALVKLSQTVKVVARFAKNNKEKLKTTVKDFADFSDILLSRKAQVGEFLEVMPLLEQNLIIMGQRSGGLLVKAPLGDVLGGQLLKDLCAKLPVDVCELIGTDPVGPLIDLIKKLIGG